MIKKILLSILCLIISISFCACKADEGKELWGTWEYEHNTQYEFNEGGKGCLCLVQTKNDKVENKHYEYTYVVKGDKLHIDFQANIIKDCVYTYTVEGDQLTFVGGEGTDKGTYKLVKVK